MTQKADPGECGVSGLKCPELHNPHCYSAVDYKGLWQYVVRVHVCADACVCVCTCMHACTYTCVRVCVCMCENRIEEVCRICDQLRYESIPAGATHTRGHRFLTSPFDISLALLSFAHPLLVIMGGICYSEIMMND